jgi:predicted DNA-binding transcriptional regulator AlpA
MSACRLAPADLPGWPRALRAPLAAAYLGGICLTTLHGLVAAGRLPPPVKLGGIAVWLREDLDAALDALRAPGQSIGPDPFEAGLDRADSRAKH